VVPNVDVSGDKSFAIAAWQLQVLRLEPTSLTSLSHAIERRGVGVVRAALPLQ